MQLFHSEPPFRKMSKATSLPLKALYSHKIRENDLHSVKYCRAPCILDVRARKVVRYTLKENLIEKFCTATIVGPQATFIYNYKSSYPCYQEG